MKSSKTNIWLPLLLSISMIVGIFIGYKMRDSIPGRNFFSLEKRAPVQEIMDIIKSRYVDEINLNKLADTAITAMLFKLDPHCAYISPSEIEAMNDDINGSFYGIGIEFEMYDDTLNVINVMKEGPGFKAGIQSGDKIIKSNGITIAGKKLSSDSLRSLLRGNIGSSLNVELFRVGKKINLNIKRDQIPISSIDAAYMINTGIGYIKINKFSTQTYREFMTALTSLKAKGLQKLILDLRDNGGGVLDEAVEIADEFLEGDKLITYTEGKHNPKKEYRCRRLGQFEKGSLTILANEGTASASEVLMGALQDWDRATIVGRRSFGKGLVQEIFDLSDHGALKLTIARYYTPTGRCIQRSYANGEEAYYAEIENRTSNDSLSAKQNDTSTIFKSSNGKKLFAAGGITPDYQIAVETEKYDNLLNQLLSNRILSRFAYVFYLENKIEIKNYKTPENFNAAFDFNEKAWKQINDFATKDSLKMNALSDEQKNKIISFSKAFIARQAWGDEGYFEFLNITDPAVNKALELNK